MERNYELYLKKLGELGIDTTLLQSQYGEKLKSATFTNINDFGHAYDGSLIEIVLKVLTPYAVRLNELLPSEMRCEKQTLVKVCLLHHISKAIRLIHNDNIWEVEHRGILYKYDSMQPSIRVGLHSLIIAQNCGIPFTAEEAEAMTINDRDSTDEQARYHASVLATIVRQANELTYLQITDRE